MHPDGPRDVLLVLMVGKNTWIPSIFHGLVGIEVDIRHLSGKLVRDVKDPVGCHPRVATVRFLENFLFCHFGHSVVVKSEPAIVEAVFNERVVVARLSVTIMHTDALELVGVLVKTCIGFFNFALDLL